MNIRLKFKFRLACRIIHRTHKYVGNAYFFLVIVFLVHVSNFPWSACLFPVSLLLTLTTWILSLDISYPVYVWTLRICHTFALLDEGCPCLRYLLLYGRVFPFGRLYLPQILHWFLVTFSSLPWLALPITELFWKLFPVLGHSSVAVFLKQRVTNSYYYAIAYQFVFYGTVFACFY